MYVQTRHVALLQCALIQEHACMHPIYSGTLELTSMLKLELICSYVCSLLSNALLNICPWPFTMFTLVINASNMLLNAHDEFIIHSKSQSSVFTCIYICVTAVWLK